jgi:hypothetical protein
MNKPDIITKALQLLIDKKKSILNKDSDAEEDLFEMYSSDKCKDDLKGN